MRHTVANVQKFVQLGALPYVAGKTQKIELEKDTFFTSHYLIFDYLMEIADGGDAPTDPKDFARILGMIRELKITINDRDDILRVSGLDLMAIYVADHGRFPSTMATVRGANGQHRDVMPLNQWTTNSDNIALTGHDFRRVDKVEMHITWGDINDLYGDAGDVSFTNFKMEVESQGHHRYVSPMTGMIRENGRPMRYNPAVRYFNRTEEKFTQDRSTVELGRIEETDNRFSTKGVIMFAQTSDGRINPDAFSGTITMRQGDTTLAKVSVDVLRASHETAKGIATPNEVLYLPFSALFRYKDFLNTRRWKDDIIIEGDYTHAGADEDANIVTILTDSYRQERLR